MNNEEIVNIFVESIFLKIPYEEMKKRKQGINKDSEKKVENKKLKEKNKKTVKKVKAKNSLNDNKNNLPSNKKDKSKITKIENKSKNNIFSPKKK